MYLMMKTFNILSERRKLKNDAVKLFAHVTISFYLPDSPFHQEHQLPAAVCCANDPLWFEVSSKATRLLSLQVLTREHVSLRKKLGQ